MGQEGRKSHRERGDRSERRRKSLMGGLTVLGTKLGLGTKLISFKMPWTWLVLIQTLGVINEIYPFKKEKMNLSNISSQKKKTFQKYDT